MRLLVLLLIWSILILDYLMTCLIIFLLMWIFSSASTAAIVALLVGIPLTTVVFRLGRNGKSTDEIIGLSFMDQCVNSYALGLDEATSVKQGIQWLSKNNNAIGEWLTLEVTSLLANRDKVPGSLIKSATKCLMTKEALESNSSSMDFPEKVMRINKTVDDWYSSRPVT